jgi:hypothetical protein
MRRVREGYMGGINEWYDVVWCEMYDPAVLYESYIETANVTFCSHPVSLLFTSSSPHEYVLQIFFPYGRKSNHKSPLQEPLHTVLILHGTCREEEAESCGCFLFLKYFEKVRFIMKRIQHLHIGIT